MRNAMTVDVEDYFQVAAFFGVVDRADWDSFPRRVEHNTHRLLDLFDEQGIRGTFFVLGWVAERCISLVREIAGRGHEVACHGYSHQLIYQQTRESFLQETVRAKGCLEGQVQRPVLGYRAASYSITEASLWALDILVELGFAYDSSIVPVHHDRYGLPGSPRWPYRLVVPSGGTIVEFPPTTARLFGVHLPVGGGGYFRLYPYQFSRRALRHINVIEQQPFVFYVHPWEVDPGQPRIRASRLSVFRHYTNLNRCETRLRRLLQEFEFAPVPQVIEQIDVPELSISAALSRA
jgi:polysaccharide deacetylase family protein (PEP-CTERM system associated)